MKPWRPQFRKIAKRRDRNFWGWCMFFVMLLPPLVMVLNSYASDRIVKRVTQAQVDQGARDREQQVLSCLRKRDHHWSVIDNALSLDGTCVPNPPDDAGGEDQRPTEWQKMIDL